MFVYALALAVIPATIAAVCEAFKREDPHPFAVGFFSFVACVLLDWLVIYMGIPSFANFMTGGFFWLTVLNFVICAVVSAIALGASNDGSGFLGFGIVSLVGTFGWVVVTQVMINPGVICDNSGYTKMVNLLHVEDAATAYPDTDPDHLIRVTEDMALLQASRAIGGSANVGSYLTANRAYLQKVQDHWYFIVDLKVLDWQGFRSKGAEIPGYVVVDAQDPNKEAEFRKGYKIKFAVGAGFNMDIHRHVYANTLLGTGWVIDDLDGMEVDEEWNPYYSGTLLKYEVGFKGKVVDGEVVLDPQTGQTHVYSLNEVPAWIDRIYSKELVKDYVNWWGSYFDFQSCAWKGQSGKRKIDDVHYVVSSKGLEYQVTMTSISSSDQALTDLIYVEPRTGHATRYKLNGSTLEGVRHLVEEASPRLQPPGFNASACQVHYFLAREVWYCILSGKGVAKDSGGSQSKGSYAGVAFVQAKNTSNNTMVILSNKGIRDAYDQLRQQIATEGTDNPTIANAIKVIQVTGIIDRIERTPAPNNSQYVVFTLSGGSDSKGVIFRALADSIGSSILMKVGDKVTVTANVVKFDYYTDVRDVTVENLPKFSAN